MNAQELAALSGAAKARTTVKKGDKEEDAGAGSGVIYLGHIPHGFYEDQMKGFFSQFGEVARVRLSRSKKTGRSRGYAFVQFVVPGVADIVADTMDHYFLSGQYLVCKVVPVSQVHEDMFAGADRAFRPVPWRLIAKQQTNKPRDTAAKARHAKKVVARQAAKRAALAAAGIDYDFEPLTLPSAVEDKPAPAAVGGRKRARAAAAAVEVEEEAVEEVPAVTPAKAKRGSKGGKKSTVKKTPARRKAARTPAAADAAAAVSTPEGRLPDPSPPLTRTRKAAKSAAKTPRTRSRK